MKILLLTENDNGVYVYEVVEKELTDENLEFHLQSFAEKEELNRGDDSPYCDALDSVLLTSIFQKLTGFAIPKDTTIVLYGPLNAKPKMRLLKYSRKFQFTEKWVNRK